jgi:hypothetical protein
MNKSKAKSKSQYTEISNTEIDSKSDFKLLLRWK